MAATSASSPQRSILRSRAGRLVVLTGASVITLVVVLSVLEATARVLVWMKYGHPGKSYGIFQRDPDIGFVHRPNSYNSITSLNNLGLRNREDVGNAAPPHAVRIVVMGGSTTFGYNLHDGDTYAERLEARLRQLPGLEHSQVLNAGVICYSAGHNYRLLQRLVPQLHPDAVVMYEGVNEALNTWVLRQDGVRVDELTGQYGRLGEGYGQKAWLPQHSVLKRSIDYYVTARITQRLETQDLAPTTVTVDRWTVENYRYLLEHMLAYLHDAQVPAIVVRYPTEHEGAPRVFADLSAQIAREHQVPVSDVAARFARTSTAEGPLFIYTGVHATARGARIIADELFDTLRATLPQLRK